jgi:hypothetical protein
MSQVVVLSSKPRDNGMVEVRLSIDTLGFTVHVPAVLADSPDAMATYQVMAEGVAAEHARLAAIGDANRAV